jgi:serine/threonine protein kinase
MSNDRNLIFGLLAHQMDFINRDQLLSAMSAWMLRKDRAIGEIMVEQGSLDSGTVSLLEALVDKHQAPASLQEHNTLAEEPVSDEEALPITRQSAPPNRLIVPSGEPVPNLRAGERFKILRLHAKGGLGSISIAHDDELKREVALKEIHREYAGDTESTSRFVMEAEITGRLEHPGVVPVYSLGSFPDGRPFYAMRFIRGSGLNHAIDHYHKSPEVAQDPGLRIIELRKLLRHFLDTCNTIEYAHSRGVIHRDLKPANIMLGRYGETIVVDWGLAKPLDAPDKFPSSEPATIGKIHRATLSDSSKTLAGLALGTPEYMSPEQAAGELERVGAVSDVYSLGATLYSILTGRPPFQGKEIGELLARVRDGDFVDPRVIDASIPAPLEAVCLKAMATRPEDRYPGPRQLADDIESWLADEPVSAYQEDFRQAVARWMRRHRSWTAAFAVALVGVTLTATAAAVKVHGALEQVRKSHIEATANFQQAREAVDTFLTSVAIDLKELPGVEHVYQQLMEKAARTYEGFIASGEHSTDHALRFQSANAINRLGEVRANMGKPTAAMAEYVKAQAIFLNLHKLFPERLDYLSGLAQSRLDMGTLYVDMSRGDETRRERKMCFEEAVNYYLQLVSKKTDQHYLAGLAESLLGLAAAQRSLDDPATEQTAWQAHDNYVQLRKIAPHNLEGRLGLGRACSFMASYMENQKREADAEKWYREAIQELESLTKERPEQPRYQTAFSSALRGLGRLLYKRHRIQEAETTVRRGIQIDQTLVRSSPGLWRYQRGLAMQQLTLAGILTDQKNIAGALACYHSAIDAYTAALVVTRSIPSLHQYLALSYTSLGDLLGEANFTEAEKSHKLAIDQCRMALQEHPDDDGCQDALAISYSNLAALYLAHGQAGAALEAYEQAIVILENLATRVHRPFWRTWPGLRCPSSTTVHAGRWRALADLHRGAEAQQQMDRFLLAQHSDPEALFAAARLMARLAGEPGLAQPEADKLRQRALDLLTRAVTAGFKDKKRLRETPEFAPLQKEPVYGELLKRH